MSTGDRERDALIAELGCTVCPCGIDLTRNGCYRCLKARGAVWHYNPRATCPACGSHIPLEGHACRVDLAAFCGIEEH